LRKKGHPCSPSLRATEGPGKKEKGEETPPVLFKFLWRPEGRGLSKGGKRLLLFAKQEEPVASPPWRRGGGERKKSTEGRGPELSAPVYFYAHRGKRKGTWKYAARASFDFRSQDERKKKVLGERREVHGQALSLRLVKKGKKKGLKGRYGVGNLLLYPPARPGARKRGRQRGRGGWTEPSLFSRIGGEKTKKARPLSPSLYLLSDRPKIGGKKKRSMEKRVRKLDFSFLQVGERSRETQRELALLYLFLEDHQRKKKDWGKEGRKSMASDCLLFLPSPPYRGGKEKKGGC